MNVRAPSPLAGEGALRVSEGRMRGRPTKPRRIARQHSRPATISSHKPLRVRVRTGGGGWVATYEDITERKRIEATISHDTTSLQTLLYRAKEEGRGTFRFFLPAMMHVEPSLLRKPAPRALARAI